MTTRSCRALAVLLLASTGALAGCDETTGNASYDPRVDGIVPHSEMAGNASILEAPKPRPAAASAPTAAPAPAAKPAPAPKPESDAG